MNMGDLVHPPCAKWFNNDEIPKLNENSFGNMIDPYLSKMIVNWVKMNK